MKKLTLAVRAAAAVLSLCAGLAQAQASKPDMGKMPANPAAATAPQGAASPGDGSQAMHKSMMSGMEGMRQMKMSGDPDKDFAMMMKMHHQQALDMAKLELEQGKAPEMKAMAKKIIAAQKKEIAEFDKWLQKHP